jgi:2-phosphoglycerate kinase
MADRNPRLTVLDDREDSRVPFLRGILTRSLQDAGLPFEEAYRIASCIREELMEQDEITTDRLREVVADLLDRENLNEVRDNYRTPRNERVSVYVRNREGVVSAFSKTTLVQSLEICAASRDELYAVAAAVERRLATRATAEIESVELTRTTYEVLTEAMGKRDSRRYLSWLEFVDTGVPLIILVGGITGSGKSTVSSLLAHRLGIIRTQSTDMLREVMRQMIPKRLMPSLHESSFMAHRAMPRWESADGELAIPHMLDGYLMQAGEVRLGIEGVFSRAVREQVSLVMEGVHVHPALQQELSSWDGAVIVPILLATLKKKALKRQLQGRARMVSSRRAERYLENLDSIWELQSFLLSEADQHEVAIITENDPDKMVRGIMREIAETIGRRYAGDPALGSPSSGDARGDDVVLPRDEPETDGPMELQENGAQDVEKDGREGRANGQCDNPGEHDPTDNPSVDRGDSA